MDDRIVSLVLAAISVVVAVWVGRRIRQMEAKRQELADLHRQGQAAYLTITSTMQSWEDCRQGVVSIRVVSLN